MSKLYFKELLLSNAVLPSLNNTITTMNQASQQTYSMNVPKGFSKYNEMINCKSSILKLTKEIQELQSWIKSSSKKIDDAITSMNNEAMLLPQSQLQTRKEVIR